MSPASAGLSNVETLDDLYAALAALETRPLWARTAQPSAEPRSRFKPMRWCYRELRMALDLAGRLAISDGAERRAILLVNAGAAGYADTVATIVSAYQMILAGERSASHRHTANALRLVLEAEAGAYTVVDGVRYDMQPGDIVLTPNWCWHGHANDSPSPAVWIDYLDVPLTRTLETTFFEAWPGGFETPKATATQSPFLYRGHEIASRLAAAAPETSGRFGRQIALDTYRFPTLGLFLCALDAGTRTSSLRTTANNIYTVVSGRGRSIIGGETIPWERGDVFVAPAWHDHQHEPDGDAVLFRLTDEPLLASFDWLR